MKKILSFLLSIALVFSFMCIGVSAEGIEKGKIKVSVGSAYGEVFIKIEDTGKGIPKKHFKSVFKPGFTTKKRGWGLGLSLAKRIVEKYHKGHIYVKSSEVGKGTTFAIEMS